MVYQDDFEVCKKNGLVGRDLTDASGKLLNTDLFCLDKGSEWVVSQMGDMLFKSEYYEHSYPHDWRTGGPDFSSQYLDVQTKSYLYEYDLESEDRQRCQYVLKFTLERFMKVLAPMCSFLAEDAYQNYLFKNEKSVFMEKF